MGNTLWTPDTCPVPGCKIEFYVEQPDTVVAVKTHRVCTAHAQFGNNVAPDAHYLALRTENEFKNRLPAFIRQVVPDAFEEIIEAEREPGDIALDEDSTPPLRQRRRIDMKPGRAFRYKFDEARRVHVGLWGFTEPQATALQAAFAGLTGPMRTAKVHRRDA